jgi:hypothetical protein
MFCKNCGAELSDGAKFCMSSGTKLVADPAIQTQPTRESMGAHDSKDDLSSKSMFDIAHTARSNGVQNIMPVSVPSNNQQPVAAKSTLSKSGVTALVLSIVTYLSVVCVASVSLNIYWVWVFLYPSTYLTSLLAIIFGITSIYGNRSKHGLVGVIITAVNLTILFAWSMSIIIQFLNGGL